jgi:hypothetical protein
MCQLMKLRAVAYAGGGGVTVCAKVDQFPSFIHTVTVKKCASSILFGEDHKVHIYLEYHGVCPLVGIETPPHPSPASECALHPGTKGGGGGYKPATV